MEYMVNHLYNISGEFKHKPLDKEFGTDMGVSTACIVNESNDIFFKEQASGVDAMEENLAKLQQSFDHKMRCNNPECYNEDGTVIPGRRRRKYSKAMAELKSKIKDMHRIIADQRKTAINRDCNEILSKCGNKGKIEPMRYKALAVRAKETKVSEKTGRFRSSARFGKSISIHSPGAFVSTLRGKCEEAGGYLSV